MLVTQMRLLVLSWGVEQSRAQTIFHMQRGKVVWSTASYSIFVPCATMVALQSDCFMRMTSHTAIDGDQTKEGQAVEALHRRLSQIEPENDRRRNASISVNGWYVFLSLKTGSIKFLSFQMPIRLSQGFLSLTEASCFVNLCFVAFGSSEKDPCNKLSLQSSFIVSSFV